MAAYCFRTDVFRVGFAQDVSESAPHTQSLPYEQNFPHTPARPLSGTQGNIQTHIITIKPRYVETDQGGVVHHSVYPVWFEMGRTELLRANNTAYKGLEGNGIFFVIAELHIKYRQPARYDEELRLETSCSEVSAAKIEHTYKLTRCCDGAILAEGSSILACVDAEGKVRRIPEFMYPAS